MNGRWRSPSERTLGVLARKMVWLDYRIRAAEARADRVQVEVLERQRERIAAQRSDLLRARLEVPGNGTPRPPVDQ